MTFYTTQHKFYCGVDLHAKTMYLCILDQEGNVVLHRNIRTNPEVFLKTIAAYREDIAVAVECIFTWYWIADLCAREGIAFVLGHALYMKAIHGGKAKKEKKKRGTTPPIILRSCGACLFFEVSSASLRVLPASPRK